MRERNCGREMNDQIERAGKVLPLALAALYVIGFLVVAVRLARYGVSSFELVKIQYLVVGFWFCCGCLVFFVVTVPLSSWLSGTLIKKGAPHRFWNHGLARALAGPVVTDFLLVSYFAMMAYTFRRDIHPSMLRNGPWWIQFMAQEVHLTRFFIELVGLELMVRMHLYFKQKANRTNVHSDLYLSRLFASFTVAIGVAASFIFALDVYPRIPFSVGGGETRQVVFWLGSNAPSDSFFERDSTTPYTVPYELLLENENSLVVISPKDNQRAIEFDRKLIGAMIVLGKRPKSAPASFQREIKEPPIDIKKP